MPEYLIPIIETQTSRRRGWRRVTADTLALAENEARAAHDDEATDWSDWEPSRAQIMQDGDRAPYEAEPRIEGVLAKYVKSNPDLLYAELLRLDDTFFIGLLVDHHERRDLFIETPGGRPVAIDLYGQKHVPALIDDRLPFRDALMTVRRGLGEPPSLQIAAEIARIWTPEFAASLFRHLTQQVSPG